LEHYLNSTKGLHKVIDLCNNDLITYLADDTKAESKEIRKIVEQIIL